MANILILELSDDQQSLPEGRWISDWLLSGATEETGDIGGTIEYIALSSNGHYPNVIGFDADEYKVPLINQDSIAVSASPTKANSLILSSHAGVSCSFDKQGMHASVDNHSMKYDGVVISGSYTSVRPDEHSSWRPWLLDFIRFLVINEVPLLGICYGHQAIARAVYGDKHVILMPVPEMGIKYVQFEDDVLVHGMPKSALFCATHCDGVVGLKSLARTSKWPNHMLRVQPFTYKGRVIAPLTWGVQFHPEMRQVNYDGILNRFPRFKALEDCEGPSDDVDAAAKLATNFSKICIHGIKS